MKATRTIPAILIFASMAIVLSGCDFAALFGGEPSTVTEELAGTYEEDLTLESGNLYLVTDDVTMNAALIIEENVFIEFGSDTRLFINRDGRIEAVGTEDDPIVMRGAVEQAGYWKGIQINSSDITNVLEHVSINHTGSSELDGDKTAVMIEGFSGAVLSVINVTVSEAEGYGLVVQDRGTIQSFSSNSFSDIAGRPMKVFIDQVASLDSASTFDDSNTDNRVEVDGGFIEEESTWPALDVPYFVNDESTIAAAWTISAGTVIQFDSAVRLIIRSDGGIVADASGGDTIVFTGGQQVPGYWRGIELNSANVTNLMDNVEISYAGHPSGFSGGDVGNMLLDGGISDAVLTLQNSTISDGPAHGIIVENGATLTDGGGNEFENIGDDNAGFEDISYE